MPPQGWKETGFEFFCLGVLFLSCDTKVDLATLPKMDDESWTLTEVCGNG